MTDRRFRVLAVASHPVQYMAPLFRRMAKHSSLDFQAAYCTLRGAEGGHDPEFDANVQWDVPLLDGYAWSHVPNRGSGKETFLSLLNPGLWKLIRSGNFDAVLCFIGYVRTSFWIACLAAKFSNAAFLFGTDATTLASRDGRAWKTRIKNILWPRIFRLADQVIVPSSGTRDLMLSLGVPGERVTLTPYSVDNEWWIEQSSQVDRVAVRAAWGVAAEDAVILFCAKLQPWKRPLDLLHAFRKANLSNAILIFAGEGPLRPQLEAEAVSFGVASRVRFLGFVNQSQLPPVYTAADLMVLPSEYEPFGVVVNEALCCGCVVAASDRCGAARDLVAPVDPQLVFPCGDIEALAKILKNAATDPARVSSIARAGFARIQTWSPERNIASTVDAIRIAVARKDQLPVETVADPGPARRASAATPKLHE